jgi:AAA+ ATPase superfamily predicted ATPase
MQTEDAVDQIRQRLSGIADIYNRLVLLVGPSRSGKTAVLRALAESDKLPVLNVGAEISRQLLDLTERQRVLQLPKLLEEAVSALPGDLTLMDNTEVLFNPLGYCRIALDLLRSGQTPTAACLQDGAIWKLAVATATRISVARLK